MKISRIEINKRTTLHLLPIDDDETLLASIFLADCKKDIVAWSALVPYFINYCMPRVQP